MSRRCLICANINPCRLHTEQQQEAELARNDAAIADIRASGKLVNGTMNKLRGPDDLHKRRGLLQ